VKILITGTPATGKTNLSLFLSQKGFNYLNLNTFAFFTNSILSYDYKRSTYVVNTKKVRIKLRYVFGFIDDIVIDSHIIEGLPRNIELVFILRCDPVVLKKRLLKKYSKEKAKENLEAEVIGVISNECHKKFNRIYEIESSDFNKAKKHINKILNNPNTKKFNKILDWLTIYEKKGKIKSLFNLINI